MYAEKERVLNVGIVGCGGFVSGNHLPNVAMNPKLHLRALCDLNSDILTRLKADYKPDYVTTDYNEIAGDQDIDMVVLGTGPKVRVAPISALAAAGKHIYVEKPMSLGYDDSREITDIVRSAGIKLQVGFNRPYCKIMQEARRIYRKMKRGQTIISYRIVGESQLWAQFHRDALAAGDSTIVHELTHIFDLLSWLTGSDPLSVYAAGGRSDNNVVTLTYPQEVAATIVSGGCGTEAYPKERMEVFSNNSVLVMNDFTELECTRIEGERDRRFPLKSNPIGDKDASAVELRRDLMAWRDKLTPEDIAVGYYYHSRPCVYKGHYDAIDHLRRCILEDMPVETDACRGATATITALKAVECLKTGMPQALDFSCLSVPAMQLR